MSSRDASIRKNAGQLGRERKSKIEWFKPNFNPVRYPQDERNSGILLTMINQMEVYFINYLILSKNIFALIEGSKMSTGNICNELGNVMKRF